MTTHHGYHRQEELTTIDLLITTNTVSASNPTHEDLTISDHDLMSFSVTTLEEVSIRTNHQSLAWRNITKLTIGFVHYSKLLLTKFSEHRKLSTISVRKSKTLYPSRIKKLMWAIL